MQNNVMLHLHNDNSLLQGRRCNIQTASNIFHSNASSVANDYDKWALTFRESFKNNTLISQIGNANKRS